MNDREQYTPGPPATHALPDRLEDHFDGSLHG
jgi:hypothetical protein